MKEFIKYYRRIGKKFLREKKKSSNARKLIFKLKNFEQGPPILLCGFPKSGNTWTRFLIFNYFNILQNQTSQTLTYEELNSISRHVLGKQIDLEFETGFPPFYRTHSSYNSSLGPTFNFFRVVYIYRHPLDCLISYYYWLMKRTIPFAYYHPKERPKLMDKNYFVHKEIKQWVEHYQSTVEKSWHVLSYESMRRDTFTEIYKLLNSLGFSVDKTALGLAVKISSAENIRKMGRETGQETGAKRRKKGFNKDYEFVRSGEVGQYHSELSAETISYVNQSLAANGIMFTVQK